MLLILCYRNGSNVTGTVAIGYNAGTAINHANAGGTTLVGYLAGSSITSGVIMLHRLRTLKDVNGGWNLAVGNYAGHAC